MPDQYREPCGEISIETKISKSRFLAHVRICRTEENVRDAIKFVCEQHKQATHNCWAYRIGNEIFKEYFSDDGEPAGTAGKPILGSIVRLDLTNVLVVVTRYFGGKKLGVRGLIEAYGSTASEALRTSGAIERTIKFNYSLSVPYEMIKSVNRLVFSVGAVEDDIHLIYGEKVDIQCAVPRSSSQDFERVLNEYLHTGRLFFWERVGWRE